MTTSVPRIMTYQGILKDADGLPVEDGDHEITFRIYDTASGGSALWEQTVSVNTANGLFSAELDMSGADLPFDTDYFLALEVGTDGEMDQRQRLSLSAYAARSDTSDFSSAGGGWVDDGFFVHLGSSIDKVGIGTSTPTSKLHVVGAEATPLVNIEQSGPFRALRVTSQNACAIWVENAGNHGLRVTNANGDGVYVQNAGNDGIHVDNAINWAGYFNGPGYFGGNVGLGTETPSYKLDVQGTMGIDIGDYFNDIPLTINVPSGQLAPILRLAKGGNVMNVVDQDGHVGIGTSSPQGALDVNSTTGAFIVPRMTTSERDALSAVNGMIIYNTSTQQFNFYENGAWVTK